MFREPELLRRPRPRSSRDVKDHWRALRRKAGKGWGGGVGMCRVRQGERRDPLITLSRGSPCRTQQFLAWLSEFALALVMLAKLPLHRLRMAAFRAACQFDALLARQQVGAFRRNRPTHDPQPERGEPENARDR